MATTSASGRLRPGDAVTVLAGEGDPVILSHQRYAVVSRMTDEGYYVMLDATFPPGEEFGPFPAAKLQRGWRDNNNRWRAP